MNVRIRKIGGGSGRMYKNIRTLNTCLPQPRLSWIEQYTNGEIVITFTDSVNIKKIKGDLKICEQVKQ